MKLGNILASIGIVLGLFGLICLPLFNFHELPFLADMGYAKGGGWKLLAQSGVFKRPGLILIVIGGGLLFFAKILPRRYWQTSEDLLEKEFQEGLKKKETSKLNLND